jgi:hypothetical protein
MFDELSSNEVAEAAKAGAAVIFPLGSIEAHSTTSAALHRQHPSRVHRGGSSEEDWFICCSAGSLRHLQRNPQFSRYLNSPV